MMGGKLFMNQIKTQKEDTHTSHTIKPTQIMNYGQNFKQMQNGMQSLPKDQLAGGT